jgi:3-methyladenine DNA glycosylase AlkD
MTRAPSRSKAKTKPKAKRSAKASTDVREVVAHLRSIASKATLDGMARYAIPSTNALGIPVGKLRAYAKSLGRDHELALALWKTGIYEARMLATFVDDPALVTPAQMEAWCRDFDNWAICDTACFALFDRTPHAWAKIEAWAGRRDEFVKRAAFALLASLSGHDKQSGDAPFKRALALVERHATDDRNFVSKAVNWALRSIGERSAALHEAALATSRRLAASPASAPRWVGKDALRQLASPAVARRLARAAARA